MAISCTGDVVLIGNTDPVRVMLNGSTDDVRADVRRLVDSMAPYENFLMSTGSDLPQETPLENIIALVDETRRTRAEAPCSATSPGSSSSRRR